MAEEDSTMGSGHWADAVGLGTDSNSSSRAATPDIQSEAKENKPITKSRHSKIRRPRISSVNAEPEDGTSNPLGPLGEDQAAPLENGDVSTLPSSVPEASRLAEDLEDVNLGNDSTANSIRKDTLGGASPTGLSRQSSGSLRKTTTGGSTGAPDNLWHFEVIVGDPTKVGDLTSAHTVYNVRTKTDCPGFRAPQVSVTRRYKDFRWLYHALCNNNPGIIVAAPPEKQTMGRFEDDFVEARRSALEKMLNKIVRHPVLQLDHDLRLFLESDSLLQDIKHKHNVPDLADNGEGGNASKAIAASASREHKGFMESIGGAFSFAGGSKFHDTDEWFIDKKAYIDDLDHELRNLLRSLDTIINQRRDLADSSTDLSAALTALATVEISHSLSTTLDALAEVESRIRDLYDRQRLQDVLTLGDTLDEYIRVVGSVNEVFHQRHKAYDNWKAAEHDLSKKKSTADKLRRQGKTQQDRLAMVQQEVSDCERRVVNAKVAFEDISKTIKQDFERFEQEKLEDFRASVETFLESAVESQKEAIELWETFYVRQGFAQKAA